MIDCWNDTGCLAKLARYTPYIFIALGFLVAGFGQFVKTKIDSRIAGLRKGEEVARKNTPPLMDVTLNRSSRTGKTLLKIAVKNEIPFKASWIVVTKRNQVVSGLLIEKPEIYPTEEKRRFLYEVSINDKKVLDDYIELRFSFESSFFAELNRPAHLRGEIVKKYRYVSGVISAWEGVHSL